MDLSIFLGVFLGVFLVTSAIGLNSAIELFYHPRALLIVVGGVVGASFIQFPFSQIKHTFSWLQVCFSHTKQDFHKDIDLIVQLSNKIKKEGKSSVIKYIENIEDDFLKTGLQLFIDNMELETLEKIMYSNIEHINNRHQKGIHFFEQLAKYAPSFGLLGTVIGLIKLLAELENPEAVGPGMSVALVTTFYGIVLANLIFLPLAGRLKNYSYEEQIKNEMLLVGVISIAKGELSFVTKEKMMMYLSKNERNKK